MMIKRMIGTPMVKISHPFAFPVPERFEECCDPSELTAADLSVGCGDKLAWPMHVAICLTSCPAKF
jgi:hypothetical protein